MLSKDLRMVRREFLGRSGSVCAGSVLASTVTRAADHGQKTQDAIDPLAFDHSQWESFVGDRFSVIDAESRESGPVTLVLREVRVGSEMANANRPTNLRGRKLYACFQCFEEGNGLQRNPQCAASRARRVPAFPAHSFCRAASGHVFLRSRVRIVRTSAPGL